MSALRTDPNQCWCRCCNTRDVCVCASCGCIQRSASPSPAGGLSSTTRLSFRNKMLKHWGVVGGLAAALAAGLYVLWGPITKRRKKQRGECDTAGGWDLVVQQLTGTLFLSGMAPGLLNLGNTCFLNSLLQGLAACPSFIRWLEVFSCSRGIQSCRDSQMSSTLLQLLHGRSLTPEVADVCLLMMTTCSGSSVQRPAGGGRRAGCRGPAGCSQTLQVAHQFI